MTAELVCFEPKCRARFAITEVIYNCPRCGGLLEAVYEGAVADPAALKKTWRASTVGAATLSLKVPVDPPSGAHKASLACRSTW